MYIPRDLERIRAARDLAWRILSCAFFDTPLVFSRVSDAFLSGFAPNDARKSEFIDNVANSSAKFIFVVYIIGMKNWNKIPKNGMKFQKLE